MNAIEWRMGWLAAAALVVVACSAPPGGGPGGDDSPPDAHEAPPDAKGPPPSCEPGNPPCPSNTECVNFGDFGGQVCASFCTQDNDCAEGYVCVPDQNNRGICATSDWAPPDGILPELLCHDENICGVYFDDNENGCKSYVNGCLNGATSGERSAWGSEVQYCVNTYSDCNAFFNCMRAEVTSCW